MQKITITAVDSKDGTSAKGKWIKTTITGADGLKASGFDAGLANLKPGNVIEAEIEVKGKFTNIGKFSVISQGQAPTTEAKPTVPPQNGKSYGKSLEVATLEEEGRNHRQELERVSIEKQTALKELGEMIRAGKADHWLSTWEWTIARMLGASPSLAHAASPVLAEDSEPKQTPKLVIPEFKNLGQFGEFWTKHGFSLPDIQGSLGISTLADIKDLADANRVLANIMARREAKQ